MLSVLPKVVSSLVSTACPVLTVPERRVAARAALGHRNARIAADLRVSVKTVEKHLTAVYRKLALSSRVELAVLWAAAGVPKRRVR